MARNFGLEYLPWSTDALLSSLSAYKNERRFLSLDIQLGGHCNFSCRYCDSPQREEHFKASLINGIEAIISSKLVKWVYVCGLGEPTFEANYKNLIKILHACSKAGIKCSIFSNLSMLTDELLSFIKNETLSILFKLDSFKPEINKDIYGIPDIQKAKEQLCNIEKVVNVASINDKTTNIGASIVPTTFNEKYILDIVRECYSKGIYPFIGELEKSGDGAKNYPFLALERNGLVSLKNDIEELTGKPYRNPICPSVISGIHVNNNGKITVDECSGLSCHWFWLDEPKMQVLGNFDDDFDLSAAAEKLIGYRNSRLPEVKKLFEAKKFKTTVFGGCGGDIEDLLSRYIKVQSELIGESHG